MKLPAFVIVCILLISDAGVAQTISQVGTDVVLFKSGATIRGTVIDSIPGKSITVVRNGDGFRFVIKDNKVFRITNEADYPEANRDRAAAGYPRNKPFRLTGILEIGILPYIGDSAIFIGGGPGISVGKNTVIGLTFNPPLSNLKGIMYGVFVRQYQVRSDTGPFLEFQAGKATFEFEGYFGYTAAFGLQLKIDRQRSVSLSAGVTNRKIDSESEARLIVKAGFSFGSQLE